MEIKLPGTEDREQQYFDDLLARIREIRTSERTPKQKVADIVSCAMDYDKEDAIPLLSLLNSRMTALGTNGDLRFANCMIMSVERWAANHHPLTMKFIEEQQRYWLMDADNNQHIYEYPSFGGIYEEEVQSATCGIKTCLVEGLFSCVCSTSVVVITILPLLITNVISVVAIQVEFHQTIGGELCCYLRIRHVERQTQRVPCAILVERAAIKSDVDVF
jgi:hypothetical protein